MDFHYPYFVILAFAILAGIVKFNNLIKSSKVFLLLLIFTFLFEVFSFIYAKINATNLVFYNLFIPIEYCFIAFGFYFELYKKWIFYTIILVFCYMIGFSFFSSIVENFYTNTLLLNFYLTILLCLFSLYSLLRLETDKDFIDFPIFWVSCGFLLFCILNLFVFGTYNFLVKAVTNKFIDKIFNYIRVYSNYMLYSIFIIVFLIEQNSISDKIDD